MRVLEAVSLSLVVGCSCSSPAGTPDAAPVDAAIDAGGDAGRCPGEVFLTGGYEDWDSTDASFHGIAFAIFQIEGDANPAHKDDTSPNGRVEMCIPPTGRSLIKVTPAAGDQHLPAHFIADAAVFSTGRIFVARGLTAARAASFFTAHGLTYDAGKADLFVQQQGTPAALTLTGATAEKTLSSPDGIAWVDGGVDKYTLFANVTISGTPHLAGPATGAGDVPMVNGELTLTSVVAP